MQRVLFVVVLVGLGRSACMGSVPAQLGRASEPVGAAVVDVGPVGGGLGLRPAGSSAALMGHSGRKGLGTNTSLG